MVDLRETYRAMQALRDSYLANLTGELDLIRDLWEYIASGKGGASQIQELYLMLHSLAGSGATFGLPGVSKTARAMTLLFQHQDDGLCFDAEQRGQMEVLLPRLYQAATEARTMPHAASRGTAPSTEEPRPLLYIVDDDRLLAEWIASRLSQWNYETRICDTPADLKGQVLKEPPLAVLMDMVFPEGELAGADAVRELRKSDNPHLPVIFMSVRDDIEARLSAVRAGASHYLVKPLDMSRLEACLDELRSTHPREPYRVLIVEDNVALSRMYALVLEEHGIGTAVENNPMASLDRLETFRPELILMDVYMPRCRGTELASIIRQDRRYDLTSIIFLSSETDFDRQMAAMNLGGDDFISKPINPYTLVKMVIPRLKRSRTMKSLAEGLQKAHDVLERKVEERTAELTEANRQLTRQIEERIQAEKKLLEKEVLLREKKNSLEESNIALKVLLREHQGTQEEIEKRALANIKNLVLPYLEDLETQLHGDQGKFQMDIIKANIEEITSSFISRLSSKYEGLSPREIQIADLIRQGRSSKEIAQLLKISLDTVDFHRRNLRNKFGLKGKKLNLRSHLLSSVGNTYE